MDTREALLTSIEQFLRRTKMPPSTFGRRAVNDGKLVTRLQSGRPVSIDTADKIIAFMAASAPATGEAA